MCSRLLHLYSELRPQKRVMFRFLWLEHFALAEQENTSYLYLLIRFFFPLALGQEACRLFCKLTGVSVAGLSKTGIAIYLYVRLCKTAGDHSHFLAVRGGGAITECSDRPVRLVEGMVLILQYLN